VGFEKGFQGDFEGGSTLKGENLMATFWVGKDIIFGSKNKSPFKSG